MRFHHIIDLVHGADEEFRQEVVAGVVMGITSAKEDHIRRHWLLRGRALRGHVGDDNVKDPAEFALLEDKHLVM